jgi:hypothetical protein
MSWTAVTPAWVVPAAVQVADLHWLAYRVHLDTGSSRCAGIGGALAWVGGGEVGPITGRSERPVTEALARAEMWCAVSISHPGTPPELERICAELGVAYRPPLAVTRGWADGAWLALQWLLGVNGAGPPMTLPRRGPDGAVLSADELFQQELARAPHEYEPAQRREALRAETRQAARRFREIAELIEDTKRRVAVA